MILVTGGTGFIGRHLIRRLAADGRDVRVLIRPAEASPALPPGVAVQAAISSLSDLRGLRASLVDVEAIFHLAGVSWTDRQLDWFETEIEGTRNLLEAAQDAGVKRMLTLSHLGADRAAAYALHKAKGIVEERIRDSQMDYTIIRSGLAFGPGDNFTVPLAKLIAISPWAFPMPGDGNALVHPIWVEDLVSCLTWALDDKDCYNAVVEIGGPEHLTLEAILLEIMDATAKSRVLASVRPSYLRYVSNFLRFALPQLPISNVWLDYLSSSRVTDIETISRVFGLMPVRFSQRLDHLREVDWGRQFLGELFGRAANA